MKNRILIATVLSLFGITCLTAQEGIGTNNPDPSSALDVSSTTQGMLIPRMTTTQRNAIASPAEGLRVYDTDTKDFWYFDGTVWVQESAAAGEWADVNINGMDAILAKQAAAAGDTIAITDNGRLFMGITNDLQADDALIQATVISDATNQDDEVARFFYIKDDAINNAANISAAGTLSYFQENATSTGNMGSVFGFAAGSIKQGSGNIAGNMDGILSNVNLSGSSSGNLPNAQAVNSTFNMGGGSNATVGNATAIMANFNVPNGTGSGSIQNGYGVWSRFNPGATSTAIDSYYGLRAEKIGANSGNVTNAYGLYLGDVDYAATNNYAIHTGLGDIRFGGLQDDADPANKVVVADANGVLKTIPTGDLAAETNNNPWDNPDGSVADQSSTDINYMDGKVGIGTANPTQSLEVFNTGRSTALINSANDDADLRVVSTATGNSALRLQNIGETAPWWTIAADRADANKLKIGNAFSVGSATRMTIDDAGNTGIGTSTPVDKLEINGSASVGEDLQVGRLANGSSLHPSGIGGNWVSVFASNFNGNLGANYPNPDAGVLLTNHGSSGILPWGMYMGLVKDQATTNADASLRMDFGKTNSLSAENTGTDVVKPFMTLRYDGKVGIGTVQPTTKFVISGEGADSGDMHGYYYGANNSPSSVSFRRARGTAAAPGAVLSGDITGAVYTAAYDGANFRNGAAMQFQAAEDWNAAALGTRMLFQTVGVGTTARPTRMNIGANGNVGIGIGNTDGDNALHVSAAIDPIKLEGLQDDTNPANKVVVADANGVLKTTDASALAAGEWEDDGAGGIRAKQANANGDRVAVLDNGTFIQQTEDAALAQTFDETTTLSLKTLQSNATDSRFRLGLNYAEIKNGSTAPNLLGPDWIARIPTDFTGNLGVLRGGYFATNAQGSGTLSNNIAVASQAFARESTGNISNLVGNQSTATAIEASTTSTITNMFGYHSRINVHNSFGGAIQNAALFYGQDGLYGGYTNQIQNHYGLWLPNIDKGANSNYAIYTGLGDIRFGGLQDDTNPANKVVVADANGVLKTTDASALAAGEWEDDGAGGIRAKQAFAAGQTVNLTDTAEFQIIKSGTEVEAQIANAGFANAQNSSIFAGNSTTKNVYNYLESNIDNGEAGDSYWSIQNNLTEISTNNTDYANQWGIMNVLSKKGTGNITGGMRGISSEAYINSSASGNANNMIMLNGFWSLASGSSVGFNRITGLNVGGSINSGFSGTVTEMRGASIGLGSPAGLVQDKYGLFIGNITNGTNSNYSIYTEAGDIRFGGLQDDANPANKVVVADANGVLKTTTVATMAPMASVFYPPATPVNITATGTGLTLDLHQEYVNLYGTPAVSSPSAGTLPTFAENELDYHILSFDTSVFANVSVSDTGVLSYDVISVPPSNTAYFNVVFRVR